MKKLLNNSVIEGSRRPAEKKQYRKNLPNPFGAVTSGFKSGPAWVRPERFIFSHPLIILVIISLFPLSGLYHSGLPNGHDTPDHVARIANFYQSLSEGNLVPRWASNLNWGYGHPVLMFLYPLSSYLAAFFHLSGLGLVDSVKLVFALTYVFSMVFMYLWLKNCWGKAAGFVAALIYGFSSYRFVDLYVRGALGEHVAFVFPPLIFLLLERIAEEKNSQLSGTLLSFAVAFLILSHNAVSLMFLPLVLLYVIYLFVFAGNKNLHILSRMLFFILMGFGLSAFFWVPAYFEGKYTLRDIVTQNQIQDRFVPLLWFVRSSWNYGGGNYFTKQIGLVQWSGFILSIYLFLQTKKTRIKMFTGGFCLVFLWSLYIMSGFSLILWDKISILQKFQFPWRFLSLTVFCAAVLGGVSFSVVFHGINAGNKKLRKTKIIVLCFLSVWFLVSTRQMWKPAGYVDYPRNYYTGIYESTTDTGESSPVWSVRFMERRPGKPAAVIEGSGSLVQVYRDTTTRKYNVTARTDVRVVENTLYFPGWQILVDGKPDTDVQFQDPSWRGLMTFRVPQGTHQVLIKFGETRLREIADYLTVISIIIVITVIIRHGIWKIKSNYQ